MKAVLRGHYNDEGNYVLHVNDIWIDLYQNPKDVIALTKELINNSNVALVYHPDNYWRY